MAVAHCERIITEALVRIRRVEIDEPRIVSKLGMRTRTPITGKSPRKKSNIH